MVDINIASTYTQPPVIRNTISVKEIKIASVQIPTAPILTGFSKYKVEINYVITGVGSSPPVNDSSVGVQFPRIKI